MTEQNHAADAPDFPLLELRDVHAAYGKIEALHGISLSISPGEIVTLIGANGAGKTTILRAISGLLRPSGGTITFNGIDTAKIAAHSLVAQGLAHAPEGRRIFTRMTVRENLELGAFRQRNKRVRIEQMQRMIGYFPILGTRMHQSAGTLSGGEQQMLAIARALMSQPRLLLLDEPSLGLAPLITAGIFEILKTVRSDGTAILLVEQNATQALALAQRGYVLELGRVVVGGESAMLATTPAVRAAYLGE